MIFIMEIGKIIVWMGMEYMSLFLGKFIKEGSRRGVSVDMEVVSMKMEESIKVCGKRILKLVWVKLNFLMESFF